MIDMFCEVTGCDRPALVRGFCGTCYKRLRRNGILDRLPLPATGDRQALAQRLESLERRRRRLNIPFKVLAHYSGVHPKVLRSQACGESTYGTRAVDRFEAGLRAYCQDTNRLMTQWGYLCESSEPTKPIYNPLTTSPDPKSTTD